MGVVLRDDFPSTGKWVVGRGEDLVRGFPTGSEGCVKTGSVVRENTWRYHLLVNPVDTDLTPKRSEVGKVNTFLLELRYFPIGGYFPKIHLLGLSETIIHCVHFHPESRGVTNGPVENVTKYLS